MSRIPSIPKKPLSDAAKNTAKMPKAMTNLSFGYKFDNSLADEIKADKEKEAKLKEIEDEKQRKIIEE